MQISDGKVILDKFIDDADEFGCFHLTKIVASLMKCDYEEALTLQADGHVIVEGLKMKKPCLALARRQDNQNTHERSGLRQIMEGMGEGMNDHADDPEEDYLERAFWEFDTERKKTGSERDSFKKYMRRFANYRQDNVLREQYGFEKGPQPR